MQSRFSKFAATALLLLFVSGAPAVFAVPSRVDPPQDRITKLIQRIRQFFTPSILEDDWPSQPIPGKP
jgi:hypothetical protein